MAAGADLAAAAAAGASKPCTSSVCAAEGEAGARAAAQLTARPDDVQCIELVLPRCCEMGSPLEHRQLTFSGHLLRARGGQPRFLLPARFGLEFDHDLSDETT